MKKFLTLIVLALLVTGCSFGEKSLYAEKVKRYESSWKAILDQDKFVASSPYFNVKATMGKKGDGYVYEIVVDQPRISLYEVEVVVVANNEPYNKETMMPSAGIFDGQYSMIPNQTDTEKSFVGGFQLNGETSQSTVNLKILVSWKDYSHLETTREFLEFNLEYKDAPVVPVEVAPTAPTEDAPVEDAPAEDAPADEEA